VTYCACTIVARNYLAQAEVLAASFAEHHPEIEFITLVIDGLEDDRDRPGVGRVLLTKDLGLDQALVNRMSVLYDVMEYATALKPSLLMALLRDGASAVAYIDPDIRFYAPIRDVFDSAAEHGIFLTPHALQPLPRDGKRHSEVVIMQAGMFNLGFIAVGSGAYRFLAWWHERMQTDAISDVSRGLFTDQRWVDWVPSLFPNVVTRDPGLNAAYWNLHERKITRRDGRFFANELPLRFFHFSGYDPQMPWLISKHMGDLPRTLLSENPDLRLLFDEYKEELDLAGHSELRKNPYLLGKLANGVNLTLAFRRIYRSLLVGDIPTAVLPPDPIGDADAFVDWMFEPATLGVTSMFSPLELGLWHHRGDLRDAFPDVHGVDARKYHAWFDIDESARALRGMLGRPGPVRPAPAAPRPGPKRPRERHPFGWSTIAYATSELGVGEAGRRMASAIAQVGVPSELVGVGGGNLSRQQHRPTTAVRGQVSFENAVVCVNADQLPRIAKMVQLDQLHGMKAGLWFWELDEFPQRFAPALDHVHEVWTASEFTRNAVQRITNKEVRLVPLAMSLPRRPTSYTRRSLGLPEDRYLFLTNFDYLSVIERKNPAAVMRAYCAAFAPTDGATLVVKSINGHLRRLDVERLRLEAADRPDVLFIDHYVTSMEMKAMIELVDCFVSLHRSEGYGLNLADAMAHGTPTIATGYSGNMDFMTDEVAEIIPYSLVEVGRNAAPYDPAAIWADPDEAAAASAMRRLFDAPDAGVALAARARDHVERNYSIDAVAAAIRPLLLPFAAPPIDSNLTQGSVA
jgi:glycosyltransferase involved in cell wall biosynthesis